MPSCADRNETVVEVLIIGLQELLRDFSADVQQNADSFSENLAIFWQPNQIRKKHLGISALSA
jgi:hypothetical protein